MLREREDFLEAQREGGLLEVRREREDFLEVQREGGLFEVQRERGLFRGAKRERTKYKRKKVGTGRTF